ncbi:LacI family DNA-binding transcriptional regulator [Streptomyces sp. NRRL F-5123]|uniref:LacI family DNA-binding transcriptional regulator n=1 Tax=Streptomyces sp. NRRL F-5123 TaxID=1463856 RepID=UPI0004E102EA|nr:LacI family DNA-binding transcriptional regulator [Streptomyces sp. NRRL F-5123]
MASIRDVARRAGVAPSTVSYVLNGDRSTTEETRQRVREAVEALDYHPRAGARMLRSGRTHVVALALPRGGGAGGPAGGRHTVDGRFAIETADAAHRLGYDLLLATSGDKASGLRRVAVSGLADAAVIMAVDLEDPRIEVVRELDFPAALIGRPADEAVLPWIDLDWEQAAVLAVRELALAGHREVVYLGSAEEEVRARRSAALYGIAGARRGGRETGAAVRVAHAVDDPAETAGLLRRLPAGPAGPPSALVVQHPTAWSHVVAAAGALGRRVPEDLAVVVIGSLPGDSSCARLPRIELPVPAMGSTAVELAVEDADARRPAKGRGRSREQAAAPGGAARQVLLAPEFLGGDALRPPQA